MNRQDWNCPKCNFRVFGSKDRCFKCNVNRQGRIVQEKHVRRTNDWNCSCGYTNFASRRTCNGCHEPRISTGMRDGDWFCLGCDELIFASKSVCRKCNLNRKGHPVEKNSIREQKSPRERDWKCSSCGENIFGFRERCRRCLCDKEGNFPEMDKEKKTEMMVDEEDLGLCVICFENPKDAGFMHGETMHRACCYPCSIQVMETSKKECPICR